MTTAIQIGPYRVISDDEFLSEEDFALNLVNQQEVSLAEVSQFLNDCSSEFSSRWQQGLTGNQHIRLSQFEEYFFSGQCEEPKVFCSDQTVSSEVCGAPLSVNQCYLFGASYFLPTTQYSGEICQNSAVSFNEVFLLKHGGLVLDRNQDYFNCHGYTFYLALGLAQDFVLDNSLSISFYATDLESSLDRVRVFTEKLQDVDSIFSEHFVPVGFISSKDIAMPRSVQQGVFSDDGPREMEQLNARFNKQFEKMVREGSLDPQKVQQGRYVLTMTQRVAHSTPDGSTSFVTHHHSGLLRFGGENWQLESKLALGAPVVLADLGPYAMLYSIGAVADGFQGSDLFYEIYEIKDGHETKIQSAIPVNRLREPLASHRFFFGEMQMSQVNFNSLQSGWDNWDTFPTQPIAGQILVNGQVIEDDTVQKVLRTLTPQGIINLSSAQVYALLDDDKSGYVAFGLDYTSIQTRESGPLPFSQEEFGQTASFFKRYFFLRPKVGYINRHMTGDHREFEIAFYDESPFSVSQGMADVLLASGLADEMIQKGAQQNVEVRIKRSPFIFRLRILSLADTDECELALYSSSNQAEVIFNTKGSLTDFVSYYGFNIDSLEQNIFGQPIPQKLLDDLWDIVEGEPREGSNSEPGGYRIGPGGGGGMSLM